MTLDQYRKAWLDCPTRDQSFPVSLAGPILEAAFRELPEMVTLYGARTDDQITGLFCGFVEGAIWRMQQAGVKQNEE